MRVKNTWKWRLNPINQRIHLLKFVMYCKLCTCFTSLAFVLQAGDTYLSNDCSAQFKCAPNGKFERTNIKGCHKNAVCRGPKDTKACQCKPGYKGDGVDVCEGNRYCYLQTIMKCNTYIVYTYLVTLIAWQAILACCVWIYFCFRYKRMWWSSHLCQKRWL